MNQYDEKTLTEWELKVDEKDELLARKRRLLLYHSGFIKELKEVEKAAEKSLPLDSIWPPERALEWRYLKELDQHGTFRRAFMVKYELIPENDLTWELAKLRKIAKVGKWSNWKGKRDTFWRDVNWYELDLIRKKNKGTPKQIIKTKELYIDVYVLSYWQRCEQQMFRKLCKIAKVVPTERERQGKKWLEIPKSDKFKLLYYLGRFNMGRAKGNLGFPAKEYPPLDGGSEELQTGRKYLIYVEQEWPEQLFSREPELPCNKELQAIRDSYNECYEIDYIYDPLNEKVEKATERIKKKIDLIYDFYQD